MLCTLNTKTMRFKYKIQKLIADFKRFKSLQHFALCLKTSETKLTRHKEMVTARRGEGECGSGIGNLNLQHNYVVEFSFDFVAKPMQPKFLCVIHTCDNSSAKAGAELNALVMSFPRRPS